MSLLKANLLDDFHCRPTSTGRIDQTDLKVTAMREIQASEAKTHLPQLLDDVERGEIIVITRRGRAIARIVPEAHLRQAEVDTAIASIKALGKRTGKITVEALVSAKHEGHKY
jgi:prevent-host-death family protein